MSAEELAQRLTINGIILERMENISSEIEKVVVGKITSINQHPENKKRVWNHKQSHTSHS